MNALIINCSPVREGPNMPECERIIGSIEHTSMDMKYPDYQGQGISRALVKAVIKG